MFVPARLRAAVVEAPRVGGVPKPPAAGVEPKPVDEKRLPTPPMLVLPPVSPMVPKPVCAEKQINNNKAMHVGFSR